MLSDNFVDYEELPGLAPTKDGVIALFRMYIAAFPDLRMVPEDLIASGGKVVATVQGHGKGDKVRIVKFRRRKHYLRQGTHRQPYTEVRITGILGG